MRRRHVRSLAVGQLLTRDYAAGAGDENRTPATSLEGWALPLSYTRVTVILRRVPPHGVGATGLEPAIFCSQSRRASRYATPRPSGPGPNVRDECKEHATAPTNPVDRTCRTEVWPGYACPVGLPRLSVSQAWAVPTPSVLRSQE